MGIGRGSGLMSGIQVSSERFFLVNYRWRGSTLEIDLYRRKRALLYDSNRMDGNIYCSVFNEFVDPGLWYYIPLYDFNNPVDVAFFYDGFKWLIVNWSDEGVPLDCVGMPRWWQLMYA